MADLEIRRAESHDIPRIDVLLYEVHKVHSDARPDLFRKRKNKFQPDKYNSFSTITKIITERSKLSDCF